MFSDRIHQDTYYTVPNFKFQNFKGLEQRYYIVREMLTFCQVINVKKQHTNYFFVLFSKTQDSSLSLPP